MFQRASKTKLLAFAYHNVKTLRCPLHQTRFIQSDSKDLIFNYKDVIWILSIAFNFITQKIHGTRSFLAFYQKVVART